jgi:hypothetical protein
MVDHVGPLIRVRLTLPNAPESVDQGVFGRRRATQTVPTLLMDIRDADGNLVELTTEHRLGVFSRQQFGEGVEVLFEVTADPEPIRKKRKVIGYVVTMRRVVDHDREPLAGVT